MLETALTGSIACAVLVTGLLGMVQMMKGTSVSATAATISGDLRLVSSAVDAKEACPETGYPYRYCVQFNGDGSAYCIMKGTPDINKNYTYQIINPNEILPGRNSTDNWIKMSADDVRVDFAGTIYFSTCGSMDIVDQLPTGTGNNVTIKVVSKNGKNSENIKVQADGSIIDGSEE